MAAGALQTPQILMLSGVGAGDELARIGIGVVHDLPGVGKNLHDHLDAVQVVVAPQLKETFGVSPGGIARVLKAIPEWRNHRRGILTTNFAEAGGFIKSQPSEAIPDLQLHFVIAKLVDHGRKTVLGHGFSGHVCVLRPQSRGSVSLASADPMAAPRIDPNFLADPDDVRRMVRGLPPHARDLRAARAGAPGRPRASALGRRHHRRRDRAVHPQLRRHDLPPRGHLPHGLGRARRRGRRPAHPRPGRHPRGRRVHHAAHHRRQHQRAHHHGRREGLGHDQGRAPGRRPPAPQAVRAFASTESLAA